MNKDLVWTHKLQCHSDIKSNILGLIDEYEQNGDCPDAVTKTDFYDDTLKSLPNYFNVLGQNANLLWQDICNKYWVSDFNVIGSWFQQYYCKDFHGWHIHPNSNISISYFLELPDSKYSTEFIDTETNSIFQSNVEEGDVVIFPSHIIHRSPLITDSNVRKTTIAINLNLGDVNTNLINPIDPIFEGTINEKNTN